MGAQNTKDRGGFGTLGAPGVAGGGGGVILGGAGSSHSIRASRGTSGRPRATTGASSAAAAASAGVAGAGGVGGVAKDGGRSLHLQNSMASNIFTEHNGKPDDRIVAAAVPITEINCILQRNKNGDSLQLAYTEQR